jgi:hypothetical protein
MFIVAALAGCGDVETEDRRGYTRAPLERPGLRIRPQERSEMDRLGEPVRPRGDSLIITTSS